VSYTLQRRDAFGDGDCQHIVYARKGKKGIVVGHSDFTLVYGMFDDEAGYTMGTTAAKVISLSEEYKEAGY